MSGEGTPAAPIHRHEGDGTMHAAMALPEKSRASLTRLFGRSLKDNHYVAWARQEKVPRGQQGTKRGRECG